MKKILKFFVILFVSILLLLIISSIILALFFDPNDYKTEISQFVQQKTNRTLTINGELNYSLFPWLGLEIGQLQLGNAQGFQQKDFAKINTAQVRVKVLPLFRGDIIVDKIVLDGLTLNLQKNKHGKTNWRDLSVGSKQTSPAPKISQHGTTTQQHNDPSSSPSASAMLLPAIAGIEIRNATIRWDDNSLNRHYLLSKFNLETGALLSGDATAVSCDFSVKSNQPALTASSKLNATLTLNLTQQYYQLENLKLEQSVTLPARKTRNITLKTKSIKADLVKQTIKVKNLSLSALDISLNGSFHATDILGDLKLTGKISSNEFIPKDLLTQLAITAPVTADKSVLTKARFETQLSLTTNSAILNKLKIILDDTSITGRVSIQTTNNVSSPAINYDLKLNEINADRYLPPPVAANKTTAKPTTTQTKHATTNKPVPTHTQAQAEIMLPIEMLRTLNVNGKMTIGKAIVSKLHSSAIKIKLLANSGVIRLYPISAKLYQGVYNGDLKLDVRKKVPLFSMNESLDGIQFGPLLKDYMGDDHILGKAKLTAKLLTRGNSMKSLRKNLNGNATFYINKSNFKYMDIRYLINKKWAQYNKQNLPDEKHRQQTLFKFMNGTINIKNGIAYNNDYQAVSKRYLLNGKGSVDLVNETINYTANIIIQNNHGELKILNNQPIPYVLSGPLDNMKKDFQFFKTIEKIAKQKIKKKIKKEEKKALKKFENKFKDKLKNLFK